MADKGQLKKNLKGLQRIHTWQLVVLLIITSFVSATFLRINNIGMVERREAVYVADESGDPEVIKQRLYDLQVYVSSHMNADLGGGVPLQYSYNRAVEEWQETQYGSSNPNGNVFVKAQEICTPRFSSWSPAYVQCVSDELAKFPSAEEMVSNENRPKKEMYVYSFSSPLWTPDFAGWSVLVSVIIALLIVARLATIGILHLVLRQHYKTI